MTDRDPRHYNVISESKEGPTSTVVVQAFVPDEPAPSEPDEPDVKTKKAAPRKQARKE